MPNTVQAAAEGMSETEALILIEWAKLSPDEKRFALAELKALSAAAISQRLAGLISNYRTFAALSIEGCEKCTAANDAPGCPPMPSWKPTGRARLDLGHDVNLRSVEYAELFFAEAVEAARNSLAMVTPLSPVLERGHGANLRRIEAYREEAIASLREQEAAYAPIEALDAATDAATEKACDALTAIYAEPCHSFADVQAKAAVMLHADEQLGLGIYERDHIDAFVKSLLGAQEA